jgi:hypothetical protein
VFLEALAAMPNGFHPSTPLPNQRISDFHAVSEMSPRKFGGADKSPDKSRVGGAIAASGQPLGTAT